MTDRYSAVRTRARLVLAEYEQKLGKPLQRDGANVKEMLVDLADRCFKLSVSEKADLPEGEAGHLDLEFDAILYRPGTNPGREAFTIAHEIGHKALEHPESKIIDMDADIDESPDYDSLKVQNGILRNYSSKSTYELEANVFASELLASTEEVRAYLLANSEWDADTMAAHFGISKLAMLNQITAAMRPISAQSPKAHLGAPVLEPDVDHDKAVAVQGPALVLAGPGAGKTRILVRRFKRLVDEGTDPRKILALTYSNKAAAEMRERLSIAMPEHAHALQVFTFHSFGLDLLRQFWKVLKFDREPTLLTPAELIAVLKVNLPSLPLGLFEDLHSPSKHLGILMDAVSRAKDELVTPAEFTKLAEEEHSVAESEEDLDKASRALDAARFFHAYEATLRRDSLLDYGDLISLAVQLIESSLSGPEICACYDHILVDEFQDINYASGRMVKGLAQQGAQVWAVGDFRQSIYRFRGASPVNIANFGTDYPGANVVTLATNYRSVQDIVTGGLTVPIPLREEVLKLPMAELRASRKKVTPEPAITFVSTPDGQSEVQSVVNLVKDHRTRFGAREVAVLCRTRANANRISEALELNGVQTNWNGDLATSAMFKDVLGILYLAIGDMRGLVRLASTAEHRISDPDMQVLRAWARDHGPSALAMLYSVSSDAIEGLSEQGESTLKRLDEAVRLMHIQPTVFHSLACYLFEGSSRCRSLLLNDSPSARRQLLTLRQLCSIARSFRPTSSADGRGRLREFVEFLEACSESKKFDVVAPDVDDADSVTVMTVHGSKGLEWNSVFVPFLANGKFPNTTYHEPIPIPDGMIRGYDPIDDASEEACLFYVAVTRARDTLTLSVADRYGRAATCSPYLTSLLEQLPEGEMLQIVRFENGAAGTEADQVNVTTSGFKFGELVPFSSLRTFEGCPKRFEFTHILELNSGDKGYRDFQRALASAQEWLVGESEQSVPSEGELLENFEAVWNDCGPVGHWYEARYKENAKQTLLKSRNNIARGASLTFGEVAHLKCEDRMVKVVIDEIEHGDVPVLKRRHFDRPAKSHLGNKDDHMPALLGAAATMRFPTSSSQVKIAYPLLGLEKDSLATETIIKKRVKKMAEIAAKAETGPYPATWNDFRCPSCPYSLICPSGSETQEAD